MDAELLVLAGIAPDRIDRLEIAVLKLRKEHFHPGPYQKLWTLVSRYYEQTGGVIPLALVTDLANRTKAVDPGEILLLAEHYSQACSTPVTEDAFRYGILALIESLATESTGRALAEALEILDRGKVERIRGEDVTRRGYEDSWESLFAAHAEVVANASPEAAPEGDIREEESAVLAEYATAKSQGDQARVLWGLPVLDGVTAGISRGELLLTVGYTGHGKSQLVTQLAWHTAVKQGKNVFFATSETIRPTVRRRLYARHSCEPQFGIKLNSLDIKNGALTHAGEQALAAVAHDLKENPGYGKLHVAQVPSGATMSHLAVMIGRAERSWPVDLVIIDYLALLSPERRRTSEREEKNEILQSAKVFATTHADGRGVPVVSPWAVSRAAWRAALDPKGPGGYTLDALADTSEAEKSSDGIYALLSSSLAGIQSTLQVLKNRDGPLPDPITLQTDFRYSVIEEQAAAELSDYTGLPSSSSDFSDVLLDD